MKLAIFGATGQTGLATTKQALEKGHQVTAFVRDPGRMPVKHENLTVVVGDVFDLEDVKQAARGQDGVVCALGARDLKKTSIRTDGTANIIQAMKAVDAKRLVVVSAMGIGESWETLSAANKFFFSVVLRNARIDHEAQEKLVKESGLDWTIIRPSGLTNSPRTGAYQVGEMITANTSQICCEDVADLILKELEQNSLVGKAVTITN